MDDHPQQRGPGLFDRAAELIEGKRENWYGYAMIDLADGFSPSEWVRHGTGKGQLIQNWEGLEPELKRAVQETIAEVTPSSFYVWRRKSPDTPVEEFERRRDWGGYSVYLSEKIVRRFLDWPDPPPIKAFRVTPRDLMLHPDMPPHGQGIVKSLRMMDEREAVLAPETPTLQEVPLEESLG